MTIILVHNDFIPVSYLPHKGRKMWLSPFCEGMFSLYRMYSIIYIYIHTHTYKKNVVTGEKDNNLYARIHVKLFNILIMEIENFMKNNVGIIKLYDKFHFLDPIRRYPCPNTLCDWFISVNCYIYFLSPTVSFLEVVVIK